MLVRQRQASACLGSTAGPGAEARLRDAQSGGIVHVSRKGQNYGDSGVTRGKGMGVQQTIDDGSILVKGASRQGHAHDDQTTESQQGVERSVGSAAGCVPVEQALCHRIHATQLGGERGRCQRAEHPGCRAAEEARGTGLHMQRWHAFFMASGACGSASGLSTAGKVAHQRQPGGPGARRCGELLQGGQGHMAPAMWGQ